MSSINEENEEHEQQVVDNIEKTSRGTVKGNLLFNYLKIGGNYFVIAIVLSLFAVTQLFASYNDFFIKELQVYPCNFFFFALYGVK